MNINEMIAQYGPILLSSTALGTAFTTLAPFALKKMKKTFKYKQMLTLYNSYKTNPALFERTYPDLYLFFSKKGWLKCKCSNCMWLKLQIKDR